MQGENLLNPDQPIYTDENGVRRFKSNEIVELIYNYSPIIFEDINERDFSQTDRDQFEQMLGNPVSSFGSLRDDDIPTLEPETKAEDPQTFSDRDKIASLEQKLDRLTGLVKNLTLANFTVDDEEWAEDDLLDVDRSLVFVQRIVVPGPPGMMGMRGEKGDPGEKGDKGDRAVDFYAQPESVVSTAELSCPEATGVADWQEERLYDKGDSVKFHGWSYKWKRDRSGNSQPRIWTSCEDWEMIENLRTEGQVGNAGPGSPRGDQVSPVVYDGLPRHYWKQYGIYSRGCFVRCHECAYVWKSDEDGSSEPTPGQSCDNWELVSTIDSPDWGFEGTVGEKGAPGKRGEPGRYNIYLVYRTDEGADWDEPDAVAVIAGSVKEAEELALTYNNDCANLDRKFPVSTALLGVAEPGIGKGCIITSVNGLYRFSLK